MQHNLGLHRFGQCTQLGVYRWLLLVLLAFVLALWSHLVRQTEQLDWAQAAELAVRLLMPQVVIISLLKELDRRRDEAHLRFNLLFVIFNRGV